MTVVDVGAGIGYYTLLASRLVGIPQRVYAFEPDPESFEYLRRNVMSNDLTSVITINKAVSNGTGTAVYSRNEHGFLSASYAKDSIPVSIVTLDDFFAEIGWPCIDLVKMDIEGSEGSALEGMRSLSHRNSRMRLIMEFDLDNLKRCGTNREALVSTLQELGFRSGYIIEQVMKPFSIAHSFPKSRATYNLLFIKDAPLHDGQRGQFDSD